MTRTRRAPRPPRAGFTAAAKAMLRHASGRPDDAAYGVALSCLLMCLRRDGYPKVPLRRLLTADQYRAYRRGRRLTHQLGEETP